MPSENGPREGLVRAIGYPGLTANIVNATIGAGIFALPAVVAAQIGAAAPLAYLICAAAMFLFVSSFAMAGSRVSLTGGLYAYVEVAFGSYFGFLAGVLYFITAILAISGIVSLVAASIGGLIPVLSGPAGRFGLIVLILGLLVSINIRGVRVGTRAVETVTVLKLVPIGLFILVGLFFLQPSNLAWPEWPSGDTLGRSVLQLLFAFVGIEIALMPSGEVKNPSRTVPRAIFTALAFTTVIYLAIQLVAQGTLGDGLAQAGEGALAEAAGQFLGGFGKILMLVGLTVSAGGWLASDILSSPRILFALGRDRFLPGVFARVHPRFHTPHVALIVYATMACALSYSSTFQKLAVLSNMAVLLLYVLCCLAAVVLKRRNVQSADGTPFHVPGGNYIPLLAVGVIIWIMAHATRGEFLITGLVLLGATLLYFIRQTLVKSGA